MRVPYEWIKELVDIEASPDEVSERLTMIGLEVEGSESADGDTVFEVNVTPNRPDCLSIIGIARELAAAFGVSLRIPPHEIEGGRPVSDFSIEILNPELCNRYAGRFIKDIKISGSPEWLRKRLEKCGIRAINNVVDITNYVLLEFGHPLHAFDADTIKEGKIRVLTAGKNNKFRTLDGVDRDLPADSLLIWDGARPVAVAGVMGGANTEVTEKTGNIFLESAYFNPVSIRKTSKKLNLKTESSFRFERGVDIEFLKQALDRAAFLIHELAGGTVYEIIDAYPVRYTPDPVEVRYERIRKVLGAEISNISMREIMKSLGIPAEGGEDVLVVYPPAHRRDIQREIDVAEEIARIYGYNRIPSTVPGSPLSGSKLNRKAINLRIIRDAMRKSGFSEVINFSFMNMAGLDMLAVPDSDKRRKVITISNALSQEDCMLRTTLIPSLINNFKFNLDRGMKNMRLFEIARIFTNEGKALPSEELRLAGIFYEEKHPTLWKEDAKGFFIAKGALEAVYEELKISGYAYSPSAEPFLHQGQSADIHISGKNIGYLGVLQPQIIEKLDLKKQKPEVVLFELNLELLLTVIPGSLQYVSIPKFPSVERDIALVVDEDLPSADIQEIIKKYPSQFIEEVTVFDYFRGGNIPPGKKSLAFNIVYRSREKTLTDDEVETIHSSLVISIIGKTGGELRK